jgi:endogenous inhibitor of DNA gyrase (YacG/DUF329 family)
MHFKTRHRFGCRLAHEFHREDALLVWAGSGEATGRARRGRSAAMNELSQPQVVRHVCPEHGARLHAPPSMVIECFCGKRCEVDVEAWVATQLDQRPGEDIEALAREAGVPAAQARAVCDQRD